MGAPPQPAAGSVVGATASIGLAVVSAVLCLALAEYLFEVGYRWIVRRTSLLAALKLEGPLEARWGPLLRLFRRRRHDSGEGPPPGSGRNGS